MIEFTDWLSKSFERFSVMDPFYAERLSAFNMLKQPNFIVRQKENYNNLSEILQLLMRWTYHTYQPTQHFLPVKVGGYKNLSDAVTLTFVNGTKLSSRTAYQGIKLRRLTDLSFLEQKETLATYMADMESSDDLFVILNKLLAQDSYLLEITGQKIINLQHIVTDSVHHIVPKLVIKVSQASQVTIVENWHAIQGTVKPFVNQFTHILLEETAQLSYHTLYTDTPPPYQVNTIYCNQKDHSTFTHHTFSFGAAMLRMHISIQINGSQARADLYGLSTLAAIEKIAQQIQVIHSAPHSLSKQHYKSILGGQSIGSFNGKIYLTPSAQQTNAYQTNNVLILSDTAHYYAKPQLKIYADDVKCSHGATAGQLDERQIFYLQTRGITETLAKRLLLEAFGAEIINSVSLDTLQDYLHDQLIAKLIKL